MSRTIPTRVDMPVDLRRRLREAAAKEGCSAHDLILEGIRCLLDQRDAAAPPAEDEPAVAAEGSGEIA